MMKSGSASPGATYLKAGLAGLPALFLLAFFVAPNALLLSASLYRSEAQQITGDLTLQNYALVLTRPYYAAVIARTFAIGIAVGAAVVVVSFPIAYFLTRTASRWRGPLTALCLAPLLASVVVKTYGWHVILNRSGALNDALLAIGAIEQRIAFIPSHGAIVVGLTHALVPYGVLTLMAALQGLNPNLERAASSLGARRRTVLARVVLPLCAPGLAAGFAIAFAVSISAYATPRMLGGPQQETLATQIYTIMASILDWSLGSTFGVVLVVSAFALLFAASALGARWRGATAS